MHLSAKSQAAFFDLIYQRDADPWDFAGSAYETGRYDAMMAALAGRRYRRAYEPGCSIGVLTERLAQVCDAVEAIEFAPTAAARASERCRHLENVTIYCASVTEYVPSYKCDLLVLSEIGYYFPLYWWRQLAWELVGRLRPGATVLATHWLGNSEDHELRGDEVHGVLLRLPCLVLEHEERHERFLLHRWARV